MTKFNEYSPTDIYIRAYIHKHSDTKTEMQEYLGLPQKEMGLSRNSLSNAPITLVLIYNFQSTQPTFLDNFQN